MDAQSGDERCRDFSFLGVFDLQIDICYQDCLFYIFDFFFQFGAEKPKVRFSHSSYFFLFLSYKQWQAIVQQILPNRSIFRSTIR